MSDKELIGTREVARLLRCSRATAVARVHNGELTPVGKIGPRGIYVFARDEIEALAAREGVAK